MSQDITEKTTGCTAVSAEAAVSVTPAADTEAVATAVSDIPVLETDDSKLINVPKKDGMDIAKNLQLLYGQSLVEIRAIIKSGR